MSSSDPGKEEFIRTFVSDLDDVKGSKFFNLSDGGAIIEICGEPGTGKTLTWWVVKFGHVSFATIMYSPVN